MKKEKITTYPNKVRIPKYLDKEKGRQILVYNKMTLSSKLLEQGIIRLPKSNLEFRTKREKDLSQVRIVPKNGYIVIEVIYEVQEILKENNGRYLSIDLGISNLATCSSNVIEPFIIDGKKIKSINHFYNKKTSLLKTKLSKNQYSSKRIKHLTYKRNQKIKWLFHNISKYIVNQAVSNSLNTIVIGYNKEWKQEVNLGKVNNQNFVEIPYSILIQMISYKAKLQGIQVFLQEESYTSKASFLDKDNIPEKFTKSFKPSGERKQRGLYSSPKGLLNADVNGSLNILRKFLKCNSDVLLEPADMSHVDWPERIKNPQRVLF